MGHAMKKKGIQLNSEIDGTLWFSIGASDKITDRRVNLLEEIGNVGSISQAAKNVGLSYKAAWDAVNEMNNLSDQPLVTRITGGKGGGGAALTDQAKNLVETYRIINQEHRKFLEKIGDIQGNLETLHSFFKRTSLRTSARNQIYGSISSIKKGPVSSEISIKLKGSDTLTALITNDSVSELDLKKGKSVYALMKATGILLSIDPEIQTSARNKLCGTVTEIDESKVNCLVSLELQGGTVISASITRQSMVDMNLKTGDPVCALFKASQVILGVE